MNSLGKNPHAAAELTSKPVGEQTPVRQTLEHQAMVSQDQDFSGPSSQTLDQAVARLLDLVELNWATSLARLLSH